MLTWIILLMVVAFSLLSASFSRATEELFMNHAIVILLIAIGILYWWYKNNQK
jgi:hypothetical protein